MKTLLRNINVLLILNVSICVTAFAQKVINRGSNVVYIYSGGVVHTINMGPVINNTYVYPKKLFQSYIIEIEKRLNSSQTLESRLLELEKRLIKREAEIKKSKMAISELYEIYKEEFARMQLVIDKQKIAATDTVTTMISKGLIELESTSTVYNKFETVKIKTIRNKVVFGISTENVVHLKEYVEVSEFSEGLALARYNNKFGFIDESNNLKISFRYDYAENFSEGLAVVKNEEEWFYIDYDGNIRLRATEIIAAGSFQFGVAVIKYDTKDFGLINKTGKAISGRYAKIEMIHKYKLAKVKDNNNFWGLMNYRGTEIVDTYYDHIDEYDENGYALFRDYSSLKKAFLYGIIDSTGKIILKPSIYSSISKYDENGYAIVKDGNEVGIINYFTGQTIIRAEYEDILLFDSEGKAMALDILGYWGLLNKDGTIAAPFEYKYIKPVSGGLYGFRCYKLSSKYYQYGYISPTGKVVIGCKYYTIEPFVESTAIVSASENKGGYGVINKEGLEFICPIFPKIERLVNAEFKVYIKGKKYSIVNNKGKCLENCKRYDKVDSKKCPY